MKFLPEPVTDIEALLDHLDAAAMQYVDVQGREAGRAALAQWPLLAKLHAYGIHQKRRDVSPPNPRTAFA